MNCEPSSANPSRSFSMCVLCTGVILGSLTAEYGDGSGRDERVMSMLHFAVLRAVCDNSSVIVWES